MKFCSHCGREVSFITPPGDHLPRFVCTGCHAIHYQNPKLVTGCVAEWQGRILICKRAIEPRAGFWTLPAGFMENGETTEAAAARETAEEALAEAIELHPFALVNVPHVDQVHLMFRAVLKDGRHAPGPESLDTRLVEEREIPWDQIAFPSVRFTLERYLDDRRRHDFGFHITTWVHPR
ncbi:MAG TPA: NUDIX hydrolase [Gammaproteobacteria bacterium]|nr:NUDIX hydrolase [Gammaproteobacteria bacterium]